MQCYLYDFYKVLASKGGAFILLSLYKSPRRFTDLATLSGLSEATVSQRLKELKEMDFITLNKRVYSLTTWGTAFCGLFGEAMNRVHGANQPQEIPAGRSGMFSVMSALNEPRTFTEMEHFLSQDMGTTTLVRCLKRLEHLQILRKEDQKYEYSEMGRSTQALLKVTFELAQKYHKEIGPCVCGTSPCLAFRANSLK